MLELFKQEIEDGLASLMTDNAIAYTLDTVTFKSENKFDAIAKMIGGAETTQTDSTLFYMDSVLATVGWNLNDDIFLADEILAARYTPVDKPFNKMHNQEDIIGHMTASRLLDSNFNVVDDLAAGFEHIAVSSVIYRAWRDENRFDEVARLIDEILSGKWKVSMECVFPKFDYGLITSEGKQVIIPRTAESSYLTKYLRKYGGTGTYKENRIGRVLRNINFCGKGLVEEPGNPYSLIFNSNKKFLGATASINEIKELVMTEQERAELEKAKTDAANAVAELAKFRADAAKEASDKLSEAVAQRDTLISEQTQTIASLREDLNKVTSSVAVANSELEALKTEKTEAVAKLEAAEAALNVIKTEKILSDRKQALAAAGIAAEKIETLVAQFASANDELFNVLVATVAACNPAHAKAEDKVMPWDKDKKDKEDKEDETCAAEETVADFKDVQLSSEAALNVDGAAKVSEDGKAIADYLTNHAFTAGKTKKTKGNK